jgi:hypothetical protein
MTRYRSKLRALSAIVMCFVPLILNGKEPQSSRSTQAATVIATRYLHDVENTKSFTSGDGREDFVFVGNSRSSSGAWRVIVVGGTKPRVIWDSFSLLHDSYFYVIGLSSIESESDDQNGYIVTLRGCAPHQCSDGKIGFAIFASRTGRTYLSHVTTKEDGGYEVTYYPKSGIPEDYRRKLDDSMCSDNGVSRPSTLPIKCLHK